MSALAATGAGWPRPRFEAIDERLPRSFVRRACSHSLMPGTSRHDAELKNAARSKRQNDDRS
jgi:hypothetical protein